MSEREPPHYLAERLRDALAHDERVNELDIHVKILGDRVFVQGRVSTPQRRDAIAIVAHEVLPDLRLVNETSVSRLDPTTHPEEIV